MTAREAGRKWADDRWRLNGQRRDLPFTGTLADARILCESDTIDAQIVAVLEAAHGHWHELQREAAGASK